MEGKEEKRITFCMVSGQKISMSVQEYEGLQSQIELPGRWLPLTEPREGDGAYFPKKRKGTALDISPGE